MTERLDLAALAAAAPQRARTRFAPAPTGYLHLGHVANAIFVWGLARAVGGTVVLRIEDHDRVRSKAVFETALIEDLAWLGFDPDEPALEDFLAGPSPHRQSDRTAAYEAALEALTAAGLAYGCRCSRRSFARWGSDHGRPWSGPGCPGGCRRLGLPIEPETAIRVALGDGEEAFGDLRFGRLGGAASADGDVLVRDRIGNWTYHFCAVVDDLEQRIDLVVRGEDLLLATPLQLRLRRLLGGDPTGLVFLHHPLVRTREGRKLSKSAGDTGVRELRAAGWPAERVLGAAAAAVGLLEAPGPVRLDDLVGSWPVERWR